MAGLHVVFLMASASFQEDLGRNKPPEVRQDLMDVADVLKALETKVKNVADDRLQEVRDECKAAFEQAERARKRLGDMVDTAQYVVVRQSRLQMSKKTARRSAIAKLADKYQKGGILQKLSMAVAEAVMDVQSEAADEFADEFQSDTSSVFLAGTPAHAQMLALENLALQPFADVKAELKGKLAEKPKWNGALKWLAIESKPQCAFSLHKDLKEVVIQGINPNKLLVCLTSFSNKESRNCVELFREKTFRHVFDVALGVLGFRSGRQYHLAQGFVEPASASMT